MKGLIMVNMDLLLAPIWKRLVLYPINAKRRSLGTQKRCLAFELQKESTFPWFNWLKHSHKEWKNSDRNVLAFFAAFYGRLVENLAKILLQKARLPKAFYFFQVLCKIFVQKLVFHWSILTSRQCRTKTPPAGHTEQCRRSSRSKISLQICTK